MPSRALLAAGGALLVGLTLDPVSNAMAATAAPSRSATSSPTAASTATPSAMLSVTPSDGEPGAALKATATLTACTPDTAGVKISGSYLDNTDEAATTATVNAMPGTTPGTYTADLKLPQDAARSDLSGKPVTYTVTATCTGSSTATVKGTDTVTVDASAPSKVSLSPTSAARGKTIRVSVTGCTGGPADVFFEDSAGTDFDFTYSTATFNDDGSVFSGPYQVPTKAALGTGHFVVECAQADTSDATLKVLAAAAPAPTPTQTATPRPTATPTAAPTATPTAGAGGGGVRPAAPATPVDGNPNFTG